MTRQFSSVALGLLLCGTLITTGRAAGPSTPTITSIQNNYGSIAPNLPNTIAQSTLFAIKGTALANTATELLSSAAPGLQTTIGGVTVNVTSGGITKQCPLYYLSATQIDAVLPGTTPLGNATLTVTNNGTTSAAFPMVIVQSGFGVLSYNGSMAAAYDASNALLTTSNSANPGQVIVLWGSGVGADPVGDDRLFPQPQNNLTSIPMQVFVGGAQAAIAYHGRSQYPGVDQVVLTIPNSAPTGCYVSLAIVSGNVVSNSVTIPIAASGRTCVDTNSSLTPDVLRGLSGKPAIKQGILNVLQTTSITARGTESVNTVTGAFQSISSGSLGTNQVSIGSCLVIAGSPDISLPITSLDAGPSISVTGPAGSLNITPIPVPGAPGGFYSTSTGIAPASFVPTSGGVFTFDNGGGGRDVGHFNTTLTVPPALVWTNAAQISSIPRSQGLNVTWSGGGTSAAYVNITGDSSATVNGKPLAVSFICLAPISAGQFTIPVPVLLALPAGTGSLSVGAYSSLQTFSAPGLDLGLVSGATYTTKTPLTYQ